MLVNKDVSIILKLNQQDATLYNIRLLFSVLYMFRAVFRSSSRAQKLYMQHRLLVILVCCDR